MKKIQDSGKLVVGTEATYPPMESIDENGNFIGLDIDIIKEIATDLEVGVEFRNIGWDELISFSPLYNDEVDVLISAITITPERAEQVAFSDPYINAGQSIVTTVEKSSEINGPEDLAGKTLGAQTGTTCEDIAKGLTEEELVMLYDDFYQAREALSEGEIDAVISDYTGALGLIAEAEGLVIIGDPFTQEFYGIAVKKENTALLQEINESIRRMKRENIIDDLTTQWFKE
jgi:polar amino acid transport system substrate-binding protein